MQHTALRYPDSQGIAGYGRSGELLGHNRIRIVKGVDILHACSKDLSLDSLEHCLGEYALGQVVVGVVPIAVNLS